MGGLSETDILIQCRAPCVSDSNCGGWTTDNKTCFLKNNSIDRNVVQSENWISGTFADRSQGSSDVYSRPTSTWNNIKDNFINEQVTYLLNSHCKKSCKNPNNCKVSNPRNWNDVPSCLISE